MMEKRASLKFADLDGDGGREVVLRNDRMYAVLSPSRGGRLIYLFTRGPRGGALVVGNPTDDWNFQEDLNRYMDRPSNHPGALADVGFEHDRYRTTLAEADPSRVLVEMTNVEAESPMYGAKKTALLPSEASALLVCYQLPEGLRALDTEACLSPDYYRLLRRGRAGLRARCGRGWRGAENGGVPVWLGLDGDESTDWGEPSCPEVGHGLNVRVRAQTDHFHLLVGCGDVDEARCRALLREGKEILHGAGRARVRVDGRRNGASSEPIEVGRALGVGADPRGREPVPNGESGG